MNTIEEELGPGPLEEVDGTSSSGDEGSTTSTSALGQESVSSSARDEEMTEIEQIARDIRRPLEELQEVVGIKRWRLPVKLTPAQKVKVGRHIKKLQDRGLLPDAISSFNDRKQSAATNVSQLRKASVTAQSTLTTFEPTIPDRRHTEEVKQARKASAKRDSNLDYLDNLKRPIWDLRKRRKTAKPTSTSTTPQKRSQIPLPPDVLENLKDIAHDAFPRRMDMPILICKIRENDAETIVAELKDIESYWKENEEDVIIRWIHVPLGNGIVHSSIEDMFRHDQPPGRPFEHAGPPGFPFLDLDSLQFRATEELEYMRNVHRTLHSNAELAKELDKSCIAGDRNETFHDDFNWRLQHLGKEQDYWENVLSDIPIELSETYSSGGGEGPIRPKTLGKGALDPSILGREDDQFKGAHLTWAPFRSFHRKDGVLLTMSAATGIDLLHRDFREHIKQPMLFRPPNSAAAVNGSNEKAKEKLVAEGWYQCRMQDPDASVVGNQMKALETRGVGGWYQTTVEYFLVYLVTEIGVTPHNLVSGHSASSLVSALKGVNRELKIQRYQNQQWVPGQTSKLVEDYLVFQDELRTLSMLFKRRLKFFKNLAKDVEAHRKQDEENDVKSVYDNTGLTPANRVKWAIKLNEEHIEQVDALFEDTKQSIEPFFKISTLQQNDLALTNDRRSKAILIFTTVTVIFLPLSFLSSYWGTNFDDIRQTDKTQDYFWKIGGTLTAVIVLTLTLTWHWSKLLLAMVRAAKSLLRKQPSYF